ncbi:MAG TPA: S9 family peptidase [Anaeromyxobacter sp.]
MTSRTALALAAALAAADPPAAAAESAPAPARAPTGIARFTVHARFVEAKISPKGTYLAAISQEGGRRRLVFFDLAKRKQIWALNPDPENQAGEFTWVNDERVVVELERFEGDLDAPVSWGELYAVDATGKGGKLVFGYRAGEAQARSRVRSAETEYASASVLGTLRGDDRKVLVASWRWEEVDPVTTISRLDAYTGVKTQVTVGPMQDAWFLTDERGEVRIAGALDDKMKPRYFHREPGGFWQELKSLSGLPSTSEPVGYVAREKTLYAVVPDGKGFAVVAVAIETGARKVLSRQDMVVPHRAIRDRDTGKIVALQWEPDVPVTDVVDPAHPVSRVLAALEAKFPDERVEVVSRTGDEKKVIVRVSSDRLPGRFLLVDAEKLTAEPLFDTRPWIVPDEMAQMSAFHVAASDGQRIHGFVTLPRGERNGPPPMVVLTHGGPHGFRDYWGFDPDVQLLASEGFAVLQVNYRGSGGYGDAYDEAGYGHWGDRVVQDVVDATRWAVRKGYADPARICAMGASFGAYASLQAAILAPDLFRCAVGYAGVYDLTRLSWTGSAPWTRPGRAYLRTALGTDGKALKAISPVFNADKLKARVFLVHGEEDKRAPIEHAEKMRKALTEAGRPPEWLVEPREGHGFYDEGARERMWTRVVAFLKESTSPAGATAAPAAAPATPGVTPAGAAPAPASAPAEKPDLAPRAR